MKPSIHSSLYGQRFASKSILTNCDIECSVIGKRFFSIESSLDLLDSDEVKEADSGEPFVGFFVIAPQLNKFIEPTFRYVKEDSSSHYFIFEENNEQLVLYYDRPLSHSVIFGLNKWGVQLFVLSPSKIGMLYDALHTHVSDLIYPAFCSLEQPKGVDARETLRRHMELSVQHFLNIGIVSLFTPVFFMTAPSFGLRFENFRSTGFLGEDIRYLCRKLT